MSNVTQPESGSKYWLARLEPVRTLAAILAVLVVFGTVLFWGYKLQDKIDRLEAQVQVLLTSSPGGQPSNSLSTACANLAQHAAEAMRVGTRNGDAAAAGIKGLMRELGCVPKN